MNSVLLRVGLLVLLGVGLFGCARPRYQYTQIESVSAPPLSATVSLNQVVLYEGTIVRAVMKAYDSDQQEMPLSLSTDDPAVLRLDTLTNSNSFAFSGRAPGTTYVNWIAEGQVVHKVVVDVLEQGTWDSLVSGETAISRQK